jgi:hypothetical protein
MCVEHEFFFQIVESATPNLNIMEWLHPYPLRWVCRLAHRNELIGALCNIMGTGLTIPYYVKSIGPNGRDLAQGFLAFREFPEFPLLLMLRNLSNSARQLVTTQATNDHFPSL